MRRSITIATEVELDITTAANWFWELDDNEQAQFLIEIERISRRETDNASVQWVAMIKHLCPQTQQMIREWAAFLGDSIEAQARLAKAEEVMTAFRAVIPDAMKKLMVIDRDGLLLADRLHKADDKARDFLLSKP